MPSVVATRGDRGLLTASILREGRGGLLALESMKRAFSLTEIVVGVALLGMLAVAFLTMRAGSERSMATLPNRLFALYFAFDLLEERLALPFSQIRSIRETRASEYVWVRKNLQKLEVESTGDRQKRAQLSRKFLERFRCAVNVRTATPTSKEIQVTVRWEEQGVDRTHVLLGVAEK